jgi:hypothetical protein
MAARSMSLLVTGPIRIVSTTDIYAEQEVPNMLVKFR